MNDSIKILEEIIEYCKEHLPPYYKDEDLQAIENLIKGYRELEEKNKQCIKAGDLERAVGFLMNRNDLVDYIPKSKIKELKKENEINIDKMRQFKHSSPFDFGVLNGIDECCRKLLEV